MLLQNIKANIGDNYKNIINKLRKNIILKEIVLIAVKNDESEELLYNGTFIHIANFKKNNK